VNINKLEVRLNDRFVGTLAEAPNHRYAFSYSEEWLDTGFAISPFSLPLRQEVFIPNKATFDGMWGVFADSLPDAWGRLLVDRMLRKEGVSLDEITPMDRLAIVGASGMGALTYRPARNSKRTAPEPENWDELSAQCCALLNHESISEPDNLFQLGGSSGGARPKVMTDDWIVKFPSSGDMVEVGRMEKEYMDTAFHCGITVPESKLFPSKQCGGYFAVRRFDRDHGLKKHVLTASAILEIDWRSAALDYHTLMKLTKILSRSNGEDLLQMYRRMCFNVFAHNRDDHANNFSWIYDERYDCWHPSPAYDLTWSTTYHGEHTTTVDGNGRNPGMQELLNVGYKAGLSRAICKQIAEEIREKTIRLEEKYRNIKS